MGATRIPSGWLVDAHHAAEPARLFLVRAGGAATLVGQTYGGYAVSPDGALVVTVGSAGTVEARELPSLAVVRPAQVSSDVGLVVNEVTASWALVMDVSGDGSPTTGYAWNLRTGQVVATEAPVNLWGMSDQGRVLRRTGPADAACLNLVAMANLAPVGRGGVCVPDLGGAGVHGDLSPAGTWAVVKTIETPPVLVRTADITAGRWKPVPAAGLGVEDRIDFWTSDRTFVTSVSEGLLRHCEVNAHCTPIALPSHPNPPHPTLIPTCASPARSRRVEHGIRCPAFWITVRRSSRRVRIGVGVRVQPLARRTVATCRPRRTDTW